MTTYYVNYATGSDTNSGTSASSPWKHAPGDPNATGKVEKADLVGGDEVLFKAGVVYQGSIDVAASGIRYEGTGWGTGQAIMSGLSSVQLNFTVDPANSKLSVATLPAGMIPTGLSTEVLSAQDNIVEIDGNVMSMSNNSTSSNPDFPDLGAISSTASQMKGSGSTWTFTDPKLGAELAALSTTQIDNLVFRTYVSGNMDLNMTVTRFNGTNTLSLSGAYQAPSSGFSYTLLNDPNVVSASNPYSEYAIEGNQIIAAVTQGVHTVSVSTSKWAFYTSGKSNVTIDGFNISGYGAGDGRGIIAQNVPNIQITNNTLSNLATHSGYGYSAIWSSGVTGLTISGNSVGPNITYGGGIGVTTSTSASVTGNTITSPGWTGIVAFDDVNTAISQNRISNTFGPHASGIIAFANNTAKGAQQSQNVSITNNQIENGNGGIFIEGDPARSGPSAMPNNFTIAYNVITNQAGQGIGDWGKTNTANVYGNVLLNSGPVAVGRNSENISYYGNIFQAYPYINPKSQPAGVTFSNNVALTTAYLTSDVDNTAPFGVNNTVDTALASILQQALGSPGVLPTSIGSILRPTGSGAIGIDYSTSLVTGSVTGHL
jgi:parallel beta-helix repeat protein